MNNKKEHNDPYLSLLLQVTTGNHEAFDRLYRETSQQLKVYLYRLMLHQDSVEDLLVETYTQVWNNSGRFQRKSKVLTWIFGIARNLAFKEMAQRKFFDDVTDYPELASPEIDNDAGNRKEVLCRALEQLSVKHREVLDLAFFHDLPYQEIARLLSIPESTVKSRVFYAKEALKHTLEHMGVYRGDL